MGVGKIWRQMGRNFPIQRERLPKPAFPFFKASPAGDCTSKYIPDAELFHLCQQPQLFPQSGHFRSKL